MTIHLNDLVSLGVLGASIVAIIVGIVTLTKYIAKRYEASVNEIIAPVITKLTREFSGNGNGAREAINELHVKVDRGFRDLTARINVLESQRVQRHEKGADDE